MVADHQGRERQGGISRFVADMLERDAVKLPLRQAKSRKGGWMI
jgi:hypothetical protein